MELEADLHVLIEHEHGGEFRAELVSEVIERADDFLLQEFFDFDLIEQTAGDHLAHLESALAALEEFVRLLERRRAAHGAFCGEVGVFARLRDVRVLAGLRHHVGSEALDLAHELVAREAAVFHLAEFEFPVARHLRGSQGLGPDFDELVNEGDPLERGHQFAAIAREILVLHEALDDRRARRRSAETALAHGGGEFLVLHQLARAFHRREQRRLVVARRRLGHVLHDFDAVILRRLAAFHSHQRPLAFAHGLLAVHFQPARHEEDLPFRLEGIPGDARDARGDLKLRLREENRDVAPRHQIIDALLLRLEALGHHARWGDGKVVADFGIVEDALGGEDPLLRHHGARVFRQVGGERIHAGVVEPRKAAHHVLHRADIVLRQVAAVRPRICQRLVRLVKRLRDLQRAARGESELVAGLALEAGEVEQRRAAFLLRLLHFLDNARLPLAARLDRLRLLHLPESLRLAVLVVVFFERLIKPPALVAAGGDGEIPEHFPVSARHKRRDVLLPVHQNGQRRRLHAAHRRLQKPAVPRIERRHRARPVDAHQPVALAAADGSIGQRQHVAVLAELVVGGHDAPRGHGLHPEAAARLLAAARLHDVAEDQLALPPGVAGIDDIGDIAALEEAFEHIEPLGIPFDRLQLELVRQDRQALEIPPGLLPVHLREGQFQEVPDGGGNDVRLVLEPVFFFLELAHPRCLREHAGKVCGDGWLLGDDEGFAHYI